MKKTLKLLALALAVICSFAIVGCGGGTGPSGGGTSTGGSANVPDTPSYTVNFNLPITTEATIKVAIPDNVPERKKIDSVIKEFNKKYPKITVKTSTFVIDNYVQTIIQQGKANLLADVIWCNSSNYYALIANGYALGLNEYFKQAKTAGVMDYDKDFTEDFKKMGKFGDEVYAIARSTDSVVTFYNKEILTEAGVDLSVFKNGWTWNDLLSVCQTLREFYDAKGQRTAYPLDANIGWESIGYPIIKSLGGEIIDENGNFCLSEELALKAYDFIQELVEKRYIPKTNDSITSFESGTGALLFQSASIDVYQEAAATSGKFDVVSFPLIGETPNIGFGFAGYAVNKQALEDEARLNASLAFMTYLMSKDGQQVMAEQGGLNLPSIRKDLSATNPEAKWCVKYQNDFNVEAYTYGAEYKLGVDFLGYVKPTLANSVISALSRFTGTYCVEKQKNEVYNLFKGDIQDAMEDV